MSDVPYGFCECGCGQRTNLAAGTDRRAGHVKGEPMRFIKGHSSYAHRRVDIEPPNPSGICMCGCGEKTDVATKTRPTLGHLRGEPIRFVHGHNGSPGAPRYIEEDRGYETPCWVWQRTLDGSGYGRWGGQGAHRRFYIEAHGPVPTGLQLDHLCRVRACVNPDHLEPVTQAENARRAPRAVVTMAIARAIRSSSARGVDLARMYGIGASNVSAIRRGVAWREDA